MRVNKSTKSYIVPVEKINRIRVFFVIKKVGNNANIGIRGFTTWKQKKSSEKCYPQAE